MDNVPMNVELPARCGAKAIRLSGPSFESKQGTAFGELRVARSREVVVPGHTAMSYRI